MRTEKETGNVDIVYEISVILDELKTLQDALNGIVRGFYSAKYIWPEDHDLFGAYKQNHDDLVAALAAHKLLVAYVLDKLEAVVSTKGGE